MIRKETAPSICFFKSSIKDGMEKTVITKYVNRIFCIAIHELCIISFVFVLALELLFTPSLKEFDDTNNNNNDDDTNLDEAVQFFVRIKRLLNRRYTFHEL